MLKTICKYSILLVILSGCASGKLVGSAPSIDGDNYATIHIARPSGYSGCGVRTTIELDHKEFYWIACGEHIVFRVPLSKILTISQTTSTLADHLDIEPEKNKEYYFENDCGFGSCWFEEITRNKFINLVKRCDKAINVGF